MSQELPQTQHLILLIGENPLPNFVAASLLLSPGGTVHLAHTTGTQRQARQLSEVLRSKDINCLDLPLGESESNSFVISDVITKRIQNLQGDVGLHYTGGTKAMAVHAYLALKKLRDNACFSYLDSRHLELCIDQSGNPKRSKISPECLIVTVLELMKLHGWEENSESTKEPICIEAAKAFQEFHKDIDDAALWRQWCDHNKKYEGGWNWKNGQKSKKIDISGMPEPVENILFNPINIKKPEILKALKCLGVEDKLCIEDISKSMHLEPREVRKWLDGEWLEHYVLNKIQKISQQININDSLNSVKIKNPLNKDKQEKCELDVLFTRGYQLFAVSCTTSCDKALSKSKLFEAYVRSQQLGGTEARVALVCYANPENTAALKTEVLNTFTPIGSQPRDHRIEVFGREDIPDLENKIIQWIQNVDRDAK